MKTLISVVVLVVAVSSLTGCAGNRMSTFGCHGSSSGCDDCGSSGGCGMSSYYPSEGGWSEGGPGGEMMPIPGPAPEAAAT